eukprot:jgi/Botrbrau1/14592/Bobra.242_2s0002.1
MNNESGSTEIPRRRYSFAALGQRCTRGIQRWWSHQGGGQIGRRAAVPACLLRMLGTSSAPSAGLPASLHGPCQAQAFLEGTQQDVGSCLSPSEIGPPSAGHCMTMHDNKPASTTDLTSPPLGSLHRLPTEVLLKILAKLDGTALRTARLVCRALRAACVAVITSMSYDCHLAEGPQAGTPGGPDPASPADLAERLRVFPCIHSLDLSIALHNDLLMLAIPGALSKLRELTLWAAPDPCAASLGLLAELLPVATGLTRLVLNPCMLTSFQDGDYLARAVRACRRLQKLEFLGWYHEWTTNMDGITQAIVQSPTLSAFRNQHCGWNRWLWDHLLPTESQLTRLLSLEGVGIEEEDQVEALASLTQLTRLSFSTVGPASSHVSLLSSLCAMQVLSWFESRNHSDPTIADIKRMVEPMKQLKELDLQYRDGVVAHLSSLLGSLPAITKFTLPLGSCRWPYYSMRWPGLNLQIVRPWGFRRLCHLSMPLCFAGPSQAEGFCAGLGALHHLEVCGKGRTCSQFLRHLPPIPSLTCLRIHSEPTDYDSPQGEILFNEIFWGNSSASFLGGLSRLRKLHLHHVLDVWQWDDDVRYISLLTELTELKIQGWAPRNHKLRGLPISYAQVQPLTVLRQLAILHMDYPWSSGINTKEFRDALQGIRHDMGLSPTRITPQAAPASLWRRVLLSQRTEPGQCECCRLAAGLGVIPISF